jgi:hypothetical protein
MVSLFFVLLFFSNFSFSFDNLENILEYKKESIREWLAEDGTMMLNPKEVRPPFKGFYKNTVSNDNGILFAAEFYWVLHELNILSKEDKIRFYNTVKDLEVRINDKRISGLYHRNPGRNDRYEAHDNYVGIVAASELFDLNFPKEIVEFGEKHNFIFDNINPEDKTKLTQWRQGSDIGFYKIIAGEHPVFRDLVWMILDFINSSFDSKDNASENLITWLKFKSLQMKYKDQKTSEDIRLKISVLKPFMFLWKECFLFKTEGQGVNFYFKKYFGGRNPIHPLVKLSEKIK